MIRTVCITLILFFASEVSAQCITPDARFSFIDVGEGDATVIQSGDESVLIDTGNLISGNSVLAKLSELGITQLNKIILTHPHPDHIGGIFQIAQSFPYKSIHDNGQSLKEQPEDLFRWYTDLVRKDPRYSPLHEGMSLRIGEVTLEVLSPASQLPSHDWNTNSLVFRASIGNFRALLMGDANLATETKLIRSGIDLNATLLRVGHHGADDATCEAFIKKVSPKISVVSVNENNIRGYPSPSVIERLTRKTKKVYITKNSGSVTVRVCRNGEYETDTER